MITKEQIHTIINLYNAGYTIATIQKVVNGDFPRPRSNHVTTVVSTVLIGAIISIISASFYIGLVVF